jgi:hypothetical protein
MPLIAVGVAIGADAIAASAVAATVGGIAAISTVTALEIVTAVGATLGAIGAITGNKTLSMVGLVIGAIGGIGSLAVGAGLLGADAASSAPLFGAAPTASTADSAAADTVNFVGGDATSSGMIDTPPAPPGGVGAIDPGTGEVITAPTSGAEAASVGGDAGVTQASTATNAAAPVPTGTELPSQDAATVEDSTAQAAAGGTNSTGLVVGESPVVAPTTAAANPIPGLPPGALGPGGVAAPGVGGDGVIDTPPAPPGGLGATGADGNTITQAIDPTTGKLISLPDSGSSSGVFGSIGSFLKANPLLTYGALQAGGSLLSGLTSTLTPAQVSALNAQAAANNAAAALQTQQTANLAQPKAVASSAPVTGAPQTLVPAAPTQQPAGLINQAPAAAQVTGAPA